MADKFYSAPAAAKLPRDVVIGAATNGAKVELRIDTTVPKQLALEAIRAITDKIKTTYKAGA